MRKRMHNKKKHVKQACGRCRRRLITSTYRKEPYAEKSESANFPIYELAGVYGYLEGLFRTGLRPKRDIIWGAWSQCILQKEKAHATL